MMEKVLDVKNLTISFRTRSGKVQAVRGIDFELNRGETLAVVGESGSGKSVTSKAILGILAGNAIIEGGEIIYDGKDLLKIPEDEFYRIRGDKISMIFQDPLSSLNPIMKIGKQLTEAMLLKGKARQKESRKAFNNELGLLKQYMILANGQERAQEMTQKCQAFDRFEFKHIELEKAYLTAHETAEELISDIDNVLFLIDKKSLNDPKRTVTEITAQAIFCCNPYVVSKDAEELKRLCSKVNKEISAAAAKKEYAGIVQSLSRLSEILKTAVKKEQPNFFAMGYYVVHSAEPLPNLPVSELNGYLRKYLDDQFMLSFIDDASAAVKYAAELYAGKKREVISAIRAAIPVYQNEIQDEKKIEKLTEQLIKQVRASINYLEIKKDSLAYTFDSGLLSAVHAYYEGHLKNAKESKRFAAEQAKFDRLKARNREPSWKVAPMSLINLEGIQDNILHILTRLCEHYENDIAVFSAHDFHQETVDMIDYLKRSASGVVHKVTKKMAKHKALKLMEEVGISEPRKRYRQYPFEFSGGMRQRIVIAIALAADPDILICDEPTTALDVTIQAQILELINRLKAKRNLSIIFITHDLGVVANMADRIAVMYAGKIVEYGTAEDVFYQPAHPYTWALLSSMPDLDTNEKLESIPGTPPNMIYPPIGDAFADRNKYALKIDYERQPPMFKISDTHSAATWLLHKDAPKVEIPKVVSDRIQRMKQKGLGGDRYAE